MIPIANPFEVADAMSASDNRVRQPTNPWMLDEVADLIAKKIDDCGEPDGEIEQWEPERYGRIAAHALLREGLITLRPGPLPTPTDVQVEQSITWLLSLAVRADRDTSSVNMSSIWPRDAAEAARVVNVINSLRSKSDV